MREGWTYKKLGEVAKISSGKAIPSSDIIDTFSEGLYPCYGGNGLRGYVDHFSNDGLVPVIGRVGALCGNVHLPQGKFYATEHALVVYLKTKDKPHYIEYLLSSLNLRQYAKGVAQPVLSASTLSEITIPVPPLSEQQRIVSELDLLSSIIEKKKAQLKEYDQLAQSIFFDMFGDPVSNEKGWEVKTIDDICVSIVRGPFGSALKKEFFVEPNETTYKIYEQKHAIQKNVTIGSYYVTEEKFKELLRFELRPYDIIMSCSGTIGELYRLPSDAEKGIMNQALLKFTLNNSVCYEYFSFMMEYMKNYFTVRGSGLQNIGSVKIIKSMLFGLPPLTLQQSFASKMEAIERQKALAQQSITEAETLFDSRMDYWFS